MCVVMDVEAAKIWRLAVLFLPPSPSLSLCVCACILYVCFTLVCPCLLYLFGGFRDTGPPAHVCVFVSAAGLSELLLTSRESSRCSRSLGWMNSACS